MEDLYKLYTKIFNLFHKTRLTEDFNVKLTKEETLLLLDILRKELS